MSNDLKQSKHFCMMPWTHMHLWPAGTTYPCCMSDPDHPVGNTQDQTLLKEHSKEPLYFKKYSYILEIMREKLNGVRVKENSKMISFETRTAIG